LNDEFNERIQYLERRFMILVQKIGPSKEDLDAVELMMAGH